MTENPSLPSADDPGTFTMARKPLPGPEEKLELARELFKRGQPLPPGLVRPAILESWLRSQAYGLPFDHHAHQVLGPRELTQRLRLRATLLKVAEPIMAELHHFTTGSGFVSTLTDEDGYVLKILGDAEIVRRVAEDNHMVEGCNRSERVMGTNGIGTTMALGRPLQVFAGEHYYPLNSRWICSGAPIKDSEGRTIAVHCLSGLRDNVSFHTLGLAVATAAAVSRQLILRLTLETVEKMRDQMGAIVETVPTGIMLLGRELEILNINSKTADLLRQPAANIIGRNFYDLFGPNSLDTGSRKDQIDGRTVTAGQGRRRLYFSLDMRLTSHGEAVITLEKAEAHRRRVNQVIGATAHFTFSDIIGHSPAITSALTMAKIAAENDSKVLLTGESGTGKELFAQAIHNAGPRRDGPFIAINCGAIPRSLIESELFGYERGSFTGASDEGRAGKFELADGGTIFLDEIGDMPLDVQVNLLRVLQNREVCRLGGQAPIRVNVRIIAATNRNLLTAIAENTFRRDLYYRLNVFSIHIPSLRERGGDIRLLADHFLSQYAPGAGKKLKGFTEKAYRLLAAHDWRGNVRELENTVEQAIYLATGGEIDVDSLSRLTLDPGEREFAATPAAAQGGRGRPRPGQDRTAPPRLNRDALEQALADTGGNIKKTAALLGVSRRTMYRKLALLGIDYHVIRTGRHRDGAD